MSADDAMELGRTGGSAAPIDDTVRMPWSSAAEFEEYIVRPALAILYRVAVGPGADYYCPRFLRYERTGRAIPDWHWPAFFLPVVWAFYRKLWLPGILFALLPLVGVAGFAAIAPMPGDSALAWLGAAACAIWILPGIVAATLANALLYHRTRRQVRLAEARTDKKSEVASLLAQSRGVSPVGAVVFGGGALALVFALVLPDLDTLYQESHLRSSVADSIAAMKPLLLGPAMSELSGKVILLAPTLDAAQHIHWMCIPVDVPAKYLPAECLNP